MEVVRVLLERKVFKTFDTGMLLSLASLKGGVSAGLLRPLRRYASLLRSRASCVGLDGQLTTRHSSKEVATSPRRLDGQPLDTPQQQTGKS